jgi:hypothetical protein
VTRALIAGGTMSGGNNLEKDSRNRRALTEIMALIALVRTAESLERVDMRF